VTLGNGIVVDNQFGASSFEVFGPKEFCVPSTVTVP
jgi:hypothetical protein